MLDKGQIKDWDGEPEGKTEAEAKADAAPAKPVNVDLAGAILGAREALPTGERVLLTPEEVTARKKRNNWIALSLVGFVVLIFVLTMAKVGGGIPVRM